jgi:acetyltransferase
MANLSSGLELLVGMKTDPTFGAVLLVGAGGVTAEIDHDRALELPPLNERLARRMLESLKLWKLLNGYRGRNPLDVEALIEVLIRLSHMVARHPEIRELDINPLLVQPRGVLALDARLVVRPLPAGESPRPYAHLAIRPYPEEFVKEVVLESGERLVLRPIRPEDEPHWIALRESCSSETLRARFRHLSKRPTHESAARFCLLDYDRELAIVAERAAGDQRELVGVAQLLADANHDTAEFAVLVSDTWQGRGLGQTLTEFCLTVAAQWGIHRLVGETTPDNPRMRSIFTQLGFQAVEPTTGDVTTFLRDVAAPAPSLPPG